MDYSAREQIVRSGLTTRSLNVVGNAGDSDERRQSDTPDSTDPCSVDMGCMGNRGRYCVVGCLLEWGGGPRKPSLRVPCRLGSRHVDHDPCIDDWRACTGCESDLLDCIVRCDRPVHRLHSQLRSSRRAPGRGDSLCGRHDSSDIPTRARGISFECDRLQAFARIVTAAAGSTGVGVVPGGWISPVVENSSCTTSKVRIAGQS